MEPKEPQFPPRHERVQRPEYREAQEKMAEALAPIRFDALSLNDGFRRKGFPDELAAQMAAHWSSRDMGSDAIGDKIWKQIGEFVKTSRPDLRQSQIPSSHDDLMEMALTANLQTTLKEQPSIPEHAQEAAIEERRQIVRSLFEKGTLALPAENEAYRSLEELTQDYEKFAKRYGTTAASDLWLASRKVRIPHLREQVVRLHSQRTEPGFRTKVFSEVHDYLANRYQSKYGTYAPVEIGPKETGPIKSLEAFYTAYQQLRQYLIDKGISEVTREKRLTEWINEQHLQLNEQEAAELKAAINAIAVSYNEDSLDSQRQILGIKAYMSKRAAIEARSVEEATPKKTEPVPPEPKPDRRALAQESADEGLSDNDKIYTRLMPEIGPLLDAAAEAGESKDAGYEDLLEYIQEEWERIKTIVPNADQVWASSDITINSNATPPENLATSLWLRYLSETRAERKEKKKAAEAAEKPEGFLSKWKKKLFGE